MPLLTPCRLNQMLEISGWAIARYRPGATAGSARAWRSAVSANGGK
ncbi:hypothetical protein EPIR_1549 [Erwinia piriflorinigrans CFBP 5888]|uniref:Uncharacterized protein n=1 Tax=Erwinia piriflorinigrans CFBP 5888 TaxID=1161919 RepID=V5Z7H4_9GAMM|nr:hypothetical protein EPIR_1549 [Erwinia piriflorinigrans CFBP 5888]